MQKYTFAIDILYYACYNLIHQKIKQKYKRTAKAKYKRAKQQQRKINCSLLIAECEKEGSEMFQKDREYDLICLGRAGADLNPVEFNMPMVEVRSYSISLGGSPANIACGAAKLGCRVGFIGKVSDDSMGSFVLKKLNDFKIDTSRMIRQKNVLTSLAITEVKAANDCSVLFYRDNVADLRLEPEEIPEDYIAGSKALLISGTALAQGPSREAVDRAVAYARKHRTVVAFDLDYRKYTWADAKETAECYSRLCAQSDIIFGTREEFNAVENLNSASQHEDAVSAQRFLNQKAQIVVMKHGASGFTVYLKDGRVMRQPAYPTNVRKTFGAGDALASAFLASLLKGGSIETAIDNGAVSAAIVISRTDCTEAMPFLFEIEHYREQFRKFEEISDTDQRTETVRKQEKKNENTQE